jgi:Tfp pilus assembly protein PilN
VIRINLLKNFGSASAESIQIIDEQASVRSNFVKHAFVMILGVLSLIVYETINIPELTGQLNVIQNEISEAMTFNQKMDSLKQEIEKYEADLKRLNSQTEFLQKVQKERLLSVDLISKMKDNITPKVWLNSISVADASIDIRGDAESISDVNEFNNRLAGAAYLKDVLTTSIERKNDSRIKLPIQTFHIKASYVDGKQLLDNGASGLETGSNGQKGDLNE